MRMKPAWAIEEKASIRLTSDWTIPVKVPTSIVRTATAMSTGRRSHWRIAATDS